MQKYLIQWPGHKWERVIHDKNVEWLASWKDEITNKVKYIV